MPVGDRRRPWKLRVLEVEAWAVSGVAVNNKLTEVPKIKIDKEIHNIVILCHRTCL